MKLFPKKEDSKKEHLLVGIINGIGISLFGGPIFLMGMVQGWYILFLFLVLFIASYFIARYLINKSLLLLESGDGEFWWLGGFIGFCIVMSFFFLLFSLPM